ncbi:DUF805 domain-containing protein [Amycolatopsis thermalba]|uniref:DUF805 domain-containing protein n=1 Tax=Amycolatopsis thermalba TaxID=944492 RepID=A0ABY4P1N7_9PSEU|nr:MULTISPECIES: DUF805 domain-containing protein [Amycolatopsis]UQS26162.1 DUF805 domain-containing protein [Amycolatopsis thermalba]
MTLEMARTRPTFAAVIGEALRKSFVGTGRMSRRDFWLFVLFWFLVSWGPLLTATAIGQEWVGTVGVVAGIVLMFPLISAGIRRLHDTGRSGAWCLLLPTFASFVVLILWTEAAQPHANQHGPVTGSCRAGRASRSSR